VNDAPDFLIVHDHDDFRFPLGEYGRLIKHHAIVADLREWE